MVDFRDGLEVFGSACETARLDFVPLIAETCRWVDPLTFRQLPVWYPESYRGAPSYDAKWQRQYTNTSKTTGKTAEKFEPNILAAKALWQAFGMAAHSKPKNWTVCHIWGVDDPQFQEPNSIVRDPRYYSCVANMVALPTPLKSITDSILVIKYILRVCAFHLYGWICEAEEVREEAEMVRRGTIPDNYPSNWPLRKNDKTPPGLVSFNPRVEQLIQRRKKEIRDSLHEAETGGYPHYPKEKVREVLDFWNVRL
jgi:hypothetical protein